MMGDGAKIRLEIGWAVTRRPGSNPILCARTDDPRSPPGAGFVLFGFRFHHHDFRHRFRLRDCQSGDDGCHGRHASGKHHVTTTAVTRIAHSLRQSPAGQWISVDAGSRLETFPVRSRGHRTDGPEATSGVRLICFRFLLWLVAAQRLACSAQERASTPAVLWRVSIGA